MSPAAEGWKSAAGVKALPKNIKIHIVGQHFADVVICQLGRPFFTGRACHRSGKMNSQDCPFGKELPQALRRFTAPASWESHQIQVQAERDIRSSWKIEVTVPRACNLQRWIAPQHTQPQQTHVPLEVGGGGSHLKPCSTLPPTQLKWWLPGMPTESGSQCCP